MRLFAQALIEIEVGQHFEAKKYERGVQRTGVRNGNRDRTLDIRVGSIELRVLRVRDRGYYPVLESWRRGERALVAVVQETYVQGRSTRLSSSCWLLRQSRTQRSERSINASFGRQQNTAILY